jgi:Periplasmic serine proteases (ClpP class)
MSIGYGEALKKKLHINTFAVGTNDHSDMGSGLRTLKGEELVWHQKTVDGIYDQFVSVVAEGRDMDKAAVDAIAQGRVWSGKDALSIGLVDERGTLLDAIHCAAEAAGLKKYRVEAYPERRNSWKN